MSHSNASLLLVSFTFIAFVSGASVPFQAARNAALGRYLGHAMLATAALFIVSFILVAIVKSVFAYYFALHFHYF
ncbi:DMT family transporter [Bartonella tamiae]|uniref:Uncharacterized protein n=1 Tax=Bartonella tamiae Th239 TaxID=1094558 RepID=J1K020_9HYPH|nr:DMT family transporter [Bartonella tamiae]EJF90355.1 hypothetical protein ME5_00756 [Bartonella tamiae Th239]EJF93704.1 hypothetical protein MEG_01128 [Bartonella tamiae Th307]